MGTGDSFADAGIAGDLPLLHLLDDIVALRDSRDRLDEEGQVFKRLILIGIRQLDETTLIEGGKKAFHDQTPKRRLNQVLTKCVNMKYTLQNPIIHGQNKVGSGTSPRAGPMGE